ncbi:FtsW/RodA/SpoVE family cell cycle protein [Exiguobacterium sp. AM39-5BH]|uniref:FtsW/RodA/SpoVE family cell cycle protein n=1 Tax=Exiguobacterium sp. AM39-5BH TaxID=2292355 RepID=UPI001F420498|nr:FtsW/RodA/SpoVE family cell cycle protein [Exiguobacterium sp. AM39-5BH]
MKTRFRYFDFSLFIAVLMLVGISSIMIYSASVWNRGDYANSGLFYRQLFYAGLGIVVYLIATMFRYENFRKPNILYGLYLVSSSSCSSRGRCHHSTGHERGSSSADSRCNRSRLPSSC